MIFFPLRWFIPGEVHFMYSTWFLSLFPSLFSSPLRWESLSLSLCLSIPFFFISLIIVADCAVNTAIVKYSITAHWHPSRLQVDRFVFLYRARWSNFLRKKSQYRLHLRVATLVIHMLCFVRNFTVPSITMNVGQDFSKNNVSYFSCSSHRLCDINFYCIYFQASYHLLIIYFLLFIYFAYIFMAYIYLFLFLNFWPHTLIVS